MSIVRSCVRSVVRSPVRGVFGGDDVFGPASLFSSGAQGAWYDPSDFSTLFQNSTGTTPVTAVEQPVRLMLDRSGRGNHATAPNDASRPVLRARYNQITFSEQFDNAAWTKGGTTVSANSTTAPDGTLTADTIVETAALADHNVIQTPTVAANASFTATAYVKRASGTRQFAFQFVGSGGSDSFSIFYNLGTGAVGSSGTNGTASITSSSITALADGWYRCSVTAIVSSTQPLASGRWCIANATTVGSQNYTGDGTSGLFLWGAQLLTAADQTATGGAYQRIAAATDYDTSNPVWRPYLAFDGSDDSLSTSSIDFSGTDEMTVFAGVTKLSDAATVCVMSYNGTSNASAEMFAPRTTGANGDFAFSHRTTTVQEAGAATVVLSPATAVLTGISDISASSVQLRRNGAVVQTVTTAIDANNYTSGTIRVGHRSSNLYLNGRLYSLAVLGRTATAAEIGAMEAWVNGKTGGY